MAMHICLLTYNIEIPFHFFCVRLCIVESVQLVERVLFINEIKVNIY